MSRPVASDATYRELGALLRRRWGGEDVPGPWNPPCFLGPEAGARLHALVGDELPAAIACPGSWLALARGAGCAWARADAGAPGPVLVVLAEEDPAAEHLARARLLGGDRLRVLVLGSAGRSTDRWGAAGWREHVTAGAFLDEDGGPGVLRLTLAPADEPTPVPVAARPRGGYSPVRLERLGEVLARERCDAGPTARAIAVLDAVAAAEPSLLLVHRVAPWRDQPCDAFTLAAAAQVGGEGRRVCLVAERGLPLLQVLEALHAIGEAGLALKLLGPLASEDLLLLPELRTWWAGEAADAAGLAALLETVLQDESPWLLRLPPIWDGELSAPDPGPWEPGAGRELNRQRTPLRSNGRRMHQRNESNAPHDGAEDPSEGLGWQPVAQSRRSSATLDPGKSHAVACCVVATVATLGRARRLAVTLDESGVPTCVVQAASLHPFAWQALTAPLVVTVEEDATMPALAACAHAAEGAGEVLAIAADAPVEPAIRRIRQRLLEAGVEL